MPPAAAHDDCNGGDVCGRRDSDRNRDCRCTGDDGVRDPSLHRSSRRLEGRRPGDDRVRCGSCSGSVRVLDSPRSQGNGPGCHEHADRGCCANEIDEGCGLIDVHPEQHRDCDADDADGRGYDDLPGFRRDVECDGHQRGRTGAFTVNARLYQTNSAIATAHLRKNGVQSWRCVTTSLRGWSVSAGRSRVSTGPCGISVRVRVGPRDGGRRSGGTACGVRGRG